MPLREQPGVVGADVAHRGARGGRLRRRGRLRQGPQGDVARDEAPEVRLPRLLAGEALHHDEAEDGGGPGALRARQGALGHHLLMCNKKWSEWAPVFEHRVHLEMSSFSMRAALP